MTVDTNALLAALKMSGQDVGQAQRMLSTLKALETLKNNPSPDAMTVMGILGQLNPKYLSMATLARALWASQSAEKNASDAEKEGDVQEPFVQRNHPDEV